MPDAVEKKSNILWGLACLLPLTGIVLGLTGAFDGAQKIGQGVAAHKALQNQALRQRWDPAANLPPNIRIDFKTADGQPAYLITTGTIPTVTRVPDAPERFLHKVELHTGLGTAAASQPKILEFYLP